MDGEIKKLNSLRGLAAMIVLVAHFSGATGWLGGYPGTGAGQLGVMLFFVLSGFLMSYLYLSRPASSEALWRYVVARFARVVPLFAVVVAVSAILPRLGVTGVVFDLPTRALVASHVLLLSGKSILWTIPTELHFYVVFVVFWLLAGRSFVVGVCCIAATGLLSVASGTPRYRGDVGGLAYDLRLPQVIPYFVSGVLLGVAYRRWRPASSSQRSWFAAVLLHVPVMWAVRKLPLPDALPFSNSVRFGLFGALSILVAWAAYEIIERPAQRLIRARLLGTDAASR